MLRQGRASHLWLKCIWSPRVLAYLLEEGCIVLSDTYSLEAGVSIVPFLAHIDDVFVGPTRLARMASHFHCYCLEDSYDELLHFGRPQGIEPSKEVLALSTRCWRGCESRGFLRVLCTR